jgi:hypothetical protein
MLDVYVYDDMVEMARLACVGIGLRSIVSDTQSDARHLWRDIEHQLLKSSVSSAFVIILLSLQVLDAHLNICHALSRHSNDP